MENKSLHIQYTLLNWEELDEQEQNCAEKAIAMLDKAYAPYSKFQVGASVLLSTGEIVTGSNQENAAYPSGLCAERVALFAANANYPNATVAQLYVVAKPASANRFAAAHSCGNCRQVMVESESRQKNPFTINIIIPDQKVIRIHSAKDYLPFAFDNQALI